MKKHLLQTLFFIICLAACITATAQDYHKLVKADSLALVNEFEASINLINAVLNENPRNFLKAQAFFQLSYVYLQLFELEKAREFNSKSLVIRDKLRYEFIADNFMRYGAIELLEGNLEKALTYFLEAKELPQSSFQFSGILDGYIAAAYEQLGKQDLALANYQSALEILTWELGENHPQVAQAHHNLGKFYAATGDNINAISHFDRTIVIELAATSGQSSTNQNLAQAYNARGLAVFAEKSNPEEALADFKKAVLVSKDLRRLSAVSRLNLAQMLILEKQFDLAGKEIDLVLELLYAKEDKDPDYFIPLILDKELYLNALRLKAAILLEANQVDQNTENLRKSYANSTLAIQVFEGRILAPYSNTSELPALQNPRDIYEQSIYLALKLYDATTELKYQYEAFQFAEAGRAIELKRRAQSFYKMIEKDLDEDIKKEDQRIRNQLAFLETDLAVKHKAKDYKKEALKLDADYQMLLQKIKKAAPEYFDMRYRLPKVSVREVQEKLVEDEVLLSYYQGRDLYYIFGISKNEIRTYATSMNPLLPDSSKANIRGLVSGLSNGLSGKVSLKDQEFVSIAQALYRHLIEPLKDLLFKKKKLIIIPHGDLHLLPFETLLQEIPRKKIKYKKLNYLVRDYTMSYELSADFILQKQNTSKVIVNSVSVWASSFNPEGKGADSGNEVRSVLNTFTQKNFKGKVILKMDATESQFKNEAPGYTHVHVASHYFVGGQEPKTIGLALLPSADEDGTLLSSELMNMDFRNTALVVMSQADSESGDRMHDYELLSIIQAFLVAGVDNTISRRWGISDETSTELMVHFYKKVLEGTSYPEALKYAKLKMIRKSKTAGPRLWAGFTLTGR